MELLELSILDIVFLYKSKSSKSSESSKKFLVTFFKPTTRGKSAAIFLTSSFKQLASVCSKMAKRKAPDVKVEPPTPKKKAMAKAKATASDGSAIPEATPSVASEAAAMEAPSTESKPAKARAVKDGELPAPSKDAWKDMRQQLARKAQAGDSPQEDCLGQGMCQWKPTSQKRVLLQHFPSG